MSEYHLCDWMSSDWVRCYAQATAALQGKESEYVYAYRCDDHKQNVHDTYRVVPLSSADQLPKE